MQGFSQLHYDLFTGLPEGSHLVNLDEATSSLGESTCAAHHLASLAAFANTMFQATCGPDASCTARLSAEREALCATLPQLRGYVTFLESFENAEERHQPDWWIRLQYGRLALLCLLVLTEELDGSLATLNRLVEDASSPTAQESLDGVFLFLSSSAVPQSVVQIEDACAVLKPLFDSAQATGSLGFGPHLFAAAMLKAYAHEIEKWDRECNASDSLGFPSPAWLDLLAYAALLLEVSDEADTSAERPDRCAATSAQLTAWDLGRYMARFALSPNWNKKPLSSPTTLLDPLSYAGCWSSTHASEALSLAAFTATSLVIDYRCTDNPSEAIALSLDMFARTPAYSGIPLHQITPQTDLYWALHLGFFESVPSSIKTKRDHDRGILQIQEDVQRLLSWQVKNSEDLRRRLGSTDSEIEDAVLAACPDVRSFDAQVGEYLTDAERHLERHQSADARVYYVKAIEAALNARLLHPLDSFMTSKGLGRIQLPCLGRMPLDSTRGSPLAFGVYSRGNLERWGLGDWERLLLAIPSPLFSRTLTDSCQAFGQFLRETYRWNKPPDLKPLATMLGRAQALRGGAAHAKGPLSQRERSKQAAEELRSLTLGVGQPCILAEIDRVLRPASSRTA